jgi:hypothetical protein
MGISIDTLVSHLDSGEVRAVRVGRSVLVPASEVVPFCERQRRHGVISAFPDSKREPIQVDWPDPTSDDADPGSDDLDPFSGGSGGRVYEPPGGLGDSFDDPWGTSHLFDELVYSALMIAWDFDEQIDGAPAELLEKLIVQVGEAEGFLADIKRELGMTE